MKLLGILLLMLSITTFAQKKCGGYVTGITFNPAHWAQLKGFAFTTSRGKIVRKHVGGTHTDRDRWLINVKK